MFNHKSRLWIAGGWLTGGVLLAAGAAALGAPMTTGVIELVLTACLVPPAVMLLIWRGAPAPTVAEVLHTVDGGGKAAFRP